MSLYDSRMKSHLAVYKRESLGIADEGIWRGNGKSYSHILPEAQQKQNILEPIRSEFWDYAEAHKAQLEFHSDFHHLNSSQAFAFNLFFPWFGMGESSAPLLDALGFAGRVVDKWEFESKPDQVEGTSVDFRTLFAGGTQLLVEVKLTEAHFGASIANEKRLQKLRDTYSPRLAGKVNPAMLEEAEFFVHYQLCRNVSHLDLERGDTLVLLVPQANEITWQEALRFCDKYLTERARSYVRVVAAEDLVTQLRATPGLSTRMQRQLELLAAKYLPA